MSLTVSQLLKLPCLRHTKVLAGHRSLDRIVTSISVLEYATPSGVQKQLYDSIEFWGSELVLTGFCSIADDVDAQCENIARLAEAGEVGLVLYYVGLILPAVDPRLIQLADSLDFLLICMPENEPRLRYSEVIHEVMDAIVRDELNNPTFTLDMLEQMSKVPKGQQTARTILRITSDRLRASTLLADNEYRVLSAASWPRNQSASWESLARMAREHDGRDTCWEVQGEHPFWVYRAELTSGVGKRMILLAFPEGGKFASILWKQAVEGVRLSMGVWGKDHDQMDLSELVRAILMDEPIKMRRLGDLYHIDVASLSDMWILRSLTGESLSRWTGAVRELSAQFVRVGLCENYETDILIFPIGERKLRDMDDLAAALVEFCQREGLPAMLTRCPSLRRTSDVKYAYEINQACLEDARKVFPLRPFFMSAEIELVKECRDIAAGGRERMAWYTSLLDALPPGREGQDLIQTLSVFLLDKGSSITETAAQLFVHKNTVKYRLQKASDLLGFRVGEIPQSKNLIYGLCLLRMMGSPGLPEDSAL